MLDIDRENTIVRDSHVPSYDTCFGYRTVCLRALTMQDSITESKTLNYILFMVFC